MWNKIKNRLNDSNKDSFKQQNIKDDNIETVIQDLNLENNDLSYSLEERTRSADFDSTDLFLTEKHLSKGTRFSNFGSSNLLPDIVREPIFVMPETTNNSHLLADAMQIKKVNIWEKVKENKLLVAGLTAVIVLIFSSLVYASNNNKTITIKTTDSKVTEVNTIGSITTAEALSKANITLSPHESTNIGLDDCLKDGSEVIISEPENVLVANKKKTVKVHTSLTSKKDILKQAGIKKLKNQKIKKIDKNGTTVYGVIGKNEKLKYNEKKIKRKTIYKKVDSIKGGKNEKVVKKGSDGKEKVVEIISYNKEGKKTKSTTVYKEVTQKAENKVVHIAKDSDTTVYNSSTNNIIKINKGSKMTVNVTAYCACRKCCGKTNGITASGTKANAGRTVAAYSGFPFGTKLYFPYFKNNGNNGIFIVEDRGGAITSGRIDIYFNSHSSALAFGRRTLDMYVVK